ncbi:hypothetical protein ACFRMQ_14575 [Kitasatospora sp. NPDC056783]|uniref:hypothetical protein n=1 Tax=Kitasatospora sp. NPDC056783 TaxID=3345943 RepID=UPI0036833F9C
MTAPDIRPEEPNNPACEPPIRLLGDYVFWERTAKTNQAPQHSRPANRQRPPFPRAVATGSVVLGRRIRALVRRTEPGLEQPKSRKPATAPPKPRRRSLNGDHIGKAILGIFVTVALVRLIRPVLAEVVVTLVLLWTGAAWVVAPRAGSRRTAGHGDPQVLEDPPDRPTNSRPHPMSSHEALTAWVELQVADASPKRTGLHVVELLEAMHKGGMGQELTKGELLEALRAAGIPVRSGLGAKIGDKKFTRAGVHAADLEKWLGRPLSKVSGATD